MPAATPASRPRQARFAVGANPLTHSVQARFSGRCEAERAFRCEPASQSVQARFRGRCEAADAGRARPFRGQCAGVAAGVSRSKPRWPPGNRRCDQRSHAGTVVTPLNGRARGGGLRSRDAGCDARVSTRGKGQSLPRACGLNLNTSVTGSTVLGVFRSRRGQPTISAASELAADT
jgi:hypothetical protein